MVPHHVETGTTVKTSADNTIDELEQQILAECDYGREAANIAYFGEQLRSLPFVEVPKVHARLSTDVVLTMSVVQGVHIDEFLSTKPSQKLRNLVGERLFELFYFQLLHMEALHADPHWGNYLFRSDGTVGLVDFGCVKYFTTEFMDSMRRVFLYSGPRDSEDFRSILAIRYAGSGVRLTAAMHRALAEMSVQFYGRVYPPDPRDDAKPFDFSDESFLKDYIRGASQLARVKGTLPEYVMLGRAETGLYQTLHRLEAVVHTSAIVRKYL